MTRAPSFLTGSFYHLTRALSIFNWTILGLFTGWEDAPLALEGRNEAIFAGKLMKVHGLQFDVVYTSWLSRAIETALR